MTQWMIDAETWWPYLLATTVTVAMCFSLFQIGMRCVRMARGLPSGYDPSEIIGRKASHVHLRSLAAVVAVVLASRVLIYLWTWLVDCLHDHQWTLPWQSFENLWVYWDAPHYLTLAKQWYTAPGVAGPADHYMLVFFPLFPLLVRGLSAMFGDALLSAVLLNAVCSAGAGCILFSMTSRHYGRGKAWLALAYMLLNPLAFFLGAPYSEALFLFLTLAAIDAANQRKLLLAGVLGALSAYTRMLGLVVLGVILLEGAQQWIEARAAHRPRMRITAMTIVGAVTVALGFAGYLLLNWQVSGAPFTYLQYQKEIWNQQFGNVWKSAVTTGQYMLRNFFPEDDFIGVWMPQAFAMVAVTALLALRQKRLPLPWVAYAWAYVFIALAPTWLLSGPRYLMALAVLPLLQCVITERKWFHAVFLSLQAGLLLTYTYLFVVVRCVL